MWDPWRCMESWTRIQRMMIQRRSRYPSHGGPANDNSRYPGCPAAVFAGAAFGFICCICVCAVPVPGAVKHTTYERMRGSMYDMERLLKALTLSVVVLGSVRPSSAFVLPPSRGDLRSSPPAAVARRQHDQQQCVLRRHRRQQRSSQQGSQQSRSVRSRPHFSSSAAPADAARDEEPWKEDLEAAAEPPFFPPPYYGSQQQQQYPTATSSAADRVVGQSRDAFTFAPKPLREGRVLRAMKRADVDGVVSL